MKRLLITGFEPFGGLKANPSADLASELAGTGVEGFAVRAALLPVSFGRSFEVMFNEIERFSPHYVLALGLGLDRDKLGLERIAINHIDARIADNDGAQPRGVAIRRRGKDGIFSELPMASMLEAAIAEGVPAEISNTAGTFVCNYVMYRTLEVAKKLDFYAGFVHIPPTERLDAWKALVGLRAMIGAMTLPSDFSTVETFDAAVETSNRLPI
jgi:pyroglutamyl-peptidase